MAQTCESCQSIDVREWARRGYLRPNQRFSWSWFCDGEPCGSITVRTEPHPVPGEVVLSFRSHGSAKGRLKSLLNNACASPAPSVISAVGGLGFAALVANVPLSSMTLRPTSLHAGIAAVWFMQASNYALATALSVQRGRLGCSWAGVQASSIRSPTSLAGCTGALTIGCEREHKHQRRARLAF
jgi:hypothetical protein